MLFVTIDSVDGFSHVRRQAINWNNTDLLLIWTIESTSVSFIHNTKISSQ